MIEFNVEGMTCQHCVRAVTGAVQAVHPGAEVAVDLAAGKVTIPAATAAEAAALAAAIEEEGYKVKPSAA
ncbi:MAG: heavy metal transport/detoxification protein [Acidiphilium sp. 37-67-22]|nr:MAG: heavy metal transport/detoxification protein [Acidiphilium sp. 21-66-27]OYW07380.1 MAG: heavy metal transport/detoxification protein [Acidiphilium sp. 37-67-22]